MQLMMQLLTSVTGSTVSGKDITITSTQDVTGQSVKFWERILHLLPLVVRQNWADSDY